MDMKMRDLLWGFVALEESCATGAKNLAQRHAHSSSNDIQLFEQRRLSINQPRDMRRREDEHLSAIQSALLERGHDEAPRCSQNNQLGIDAPSCNFAKRTVVHGSQMDSANMRTDSGNAEG